MSTEPQRVDCPAAGSPSIRVPWLDYARLVRLPNVFTALADIALGGAAALGVGIPLWRWPAFALLLAASACLYSGGMVWNDFFDLEQDRRERPFRPIPSGKVTRREAAGLGAVLLATGLVLAIFSGWRTDGLHATPGVLGGLLVAAILLYDGWLKRTWAGPLGMGACRFLNVLLGLSLLDDIGGAWGVHLALAVGVYIVGVTWFARTEARVSSRSALCGAAAVMLAGLVLALAVPAWLPRGTGSPLFPYMLVGLGFVLGFPACRAVAEPTPKHVQAAVKRAILGLVAFDAILATAFVGAWGLLLLGLLLPAMYLGRWVYST
jgi:hypothetical protein